MSAFRPKSGTPADSALAVRDAYDERKQARMIANGSTAQHARHVIDQARHVRRAKREQRRLTGIRVRQARGEDVG